MKTNRLISLLLCLCMVFALFTGFAETASADDYISYTVKTGDNLYTLVGKMGMNYGTVKYVIMALNGFTNEDQLSQLQPGQTILLPTSNQAAASLASKAITGTATTTAAVTTTAAAASTGTTTASGTSSTTSSTSTYQGYTPAYYLVQHTVAKGETLISICKALGTNYYDYEKTVLQINNLTSANSLKVGQQLWVPAKTGSAGGSIAVVAHSVKSGETISGICSAYGTSYANYKAAVKAVNNKLANVEKLNVGQTVYIPVYTTYTNAVAGNASTAAGTSGSPTTSIASGYAIGFSSPTNAKYGNPFAIVGTQSNVTRATAGSTVIVRPNAYDGYAVKSVKVVRTDSNAHVQMNDYAFTMPNSNVQITIEYAKGLTITKMPSSNGTFDTMVYGELGNTAFYGDTVEIVPYPNAGYEVANVLYRRWDSATSTWVPAAGTPATVDPETGIWSFPMPNAEVRVSVTFQPTTRIRLYYNRAVYLGYGVVQFYVDGVQVTEANQGDTVRMVIIPADGWIIDPDTTANGVIGQGFAEIGGTVAAGAVVNNPSFNTINDPLQVTPAALLPATRSYIAVTPRGADNITKVNDYIYEFKIPIAGSASDPGVPVGDVNVYVGFKQKTPYGLFTENLSGNPQYGTVTFTVTDPVTGEIRKNTNYAYEGDVVELVPYAAPTAEIIGGTTATGRVLSYTYNPDGQATGGYGGTDEYVTLVPSGGTMPATRWVNAPGGPANPLDAADGTDHTGYMFIMPASAVNVEAQFYNAGNAATDYSGIAYDVGIADNEHGKIEIFDSDDGVNWRKANQAIPGSVLKIRITADKGYRVQRQFTQAYSTAGNTEYGVYVNFGDYGTPSLTPLIDGLTIASGGISDAPTARTNTGIFTPLTEQTNDAGNVILEFEIVTPSITSFGGVTGTPIAITALYEKFSGNYNADGTNTVVRNKVTLRAANVDVATGTSFSDQIPANGRSQALETAVSGVSGLSNVEMYVNGVLISEGTEVEAGTVVGFRFTVKSGYKLDSVWKITTGGGGFDQQLSPVDGIYWYTVTEKDANALVVGNNPVIEFRVNTERDVPKVYSVFYSTNAGLFGFAPVSYYRLRVFDPNGTLVTDWTPGDVTANAGDTIVLRIPRWAAGEEFLNDVRLRMVTVGNSNLTMGDLTPFGTGPEGWDYTFIMPSENVKTEVYYEETQLIDLY